MVRGTDVVGVVFAGRVKPGPFSDKQVELLQTFAEQAVIAIENVRMSSETKEALERQTATAEILRVISSSPADVQPVFEAILTSATRLCGAQTAVLHLYEGDEQFRPVAVHGGKPEYRKWMLSSVHRIGRPVVRDEGPWKPAQIDDLQQLPEPFASEPVWRANVHLEGIRTLLNVPLAKEGRYIGCVTVYRREVRRFTDKEVALVQTFADQAVIAIENVRLFNETKEALERQTATAEILKVIAGTPADARPVFDAIAQSALRVFGPSHVAVMMREAGGLREIATAGSADPRGDFLIPLNRDSTSGRAVLDRTVLDIADTEAADAPPFARESGRMAARARPFA
jgi:transcriptional regulator with GAF, ATPase, and Fis domain